MLLKRWDGLSKQPPGSEPGEGSMGIHVTSSVTPDARGASILKHAEAAYPRQRDWQDVGWLGRAIQQRQTAIPRQMLDLRGELSYSSWTLRASAG